MIAGSKLVPLMVAATVVTAGRDELKMGAEKVIDTVLEVKTMVEMKEIVKVVRLDLVAGERFPEDIADFARVNMNSQGSDPGTDAWGPEWKLVRESDGARILVSCGPDTDCGTDDDLSEMITDASGRQRNRL